MKMSLVGKLFFSFATSGLAYPLGQDILKITNEQSYFLWALLFICFSIYFVGAEIGFWEDIVF